MGCVGRLPGNSQGLVRLASMLRVPRLGSVITKDSSWIQGNVESSTRRPSSKEAVVLRRHGQDLLTAATGRSAGPGGAKTVAVFAASLTESSTCARQGSHPGNGLVVRRVFHMVNGRCIPGNVA